MNNLKKTPNDVLHEWFLNLNEKPSRVLRFDIVELDELRDYLNKDAHRRLMEINSYMLLWETTNPELDFDWAVNNISQYGCNYNRLKWLIKVVNNRIRELNDHISIQKNTSYKETYLTIFYPWGYEIFKHLSDNFDHNKPTIKFSIIYLFLNGYGEKNLIKGTQEIYREFCVKEYPQEFKDVGYTRIDQSNSVFEQLNKNKSHLTDYFNEIVNLNKIEF